MRTATLRVPAPRGPAPRVGPYRVVKRLGVGVGSETLLAVQEGPLGLSRPVVLKGARPSDDEAHGVAELSREAAAQARVVHPAIVRLLDVHVDAGRPYLVLEFVDGVTLGRLFAGLRARGGWLERESALFLAGRVLAALVAAHGARDPLTGEFSPVVHRDVSPANVLVPWDGYAKLGDFGVARLAGFGSLTAPGTIKGTDGYMAPEQVAGRGVSARTDVYAACLLLLELLGGEPVFPRGTRTDLELLRAMAAPEGLPVARLARGASEELEELVRIGLAREPDARRVSAEELLGAVRREGDLERGRHALAALLAALRSEARLASDAGEVDRLGRSGAPAPSPSPFPVRAPLSAIGDEPTAVDVDAHDAAKPAAARHHPSPDDVETLVGDRGGLPLAPATSQVMRASGASAALASWPSPAASSSGSLFGSTDELPTASGAGASAPPLAHTVPPAGDGGRAPFVDVLAVVPLASTLPRASLAPPPRRRFPATLALGLPGALLVLGVGALAGRALAPHVGRPPAAATARAGAGPAPAAAPPAAPSAPAEAASPSPAPAPAPAPAPTSGTLRTPASTRANRVFVDGVVVGSGGGALEVPCGVRAVRVGSAGTTRRVEVPCGGAVDVGR